MPKSLSFLVESVFYLEGQALNHCFPYRIKDYSKLFGFHASPGHLRLAGAAAVAAHAVAQRVGS
jgi:hypothetical protein